jgi:hypothetical protein
MLIDTGGLMSDAEKLPKEQQVCGRSTLVCGGALGARWQADSHGANHCACLPPPLIGLRLPLPPPIAGHRAAQHQRSGAAGRH